MAEHFNLYIGLGNDAMSSPDDLADALLGVAKQVRLGDIWDNVRDANGNTVGNWTISIDTEKDNTCTVKE